MLVGWLVPVEVVVGFVTHGMQAKARRVYDFCQPFVAWLGDGERVVLLGGGGVLKTT
jgi:hypothetical protein